MKLIHFGSSLITKSYSDIDIAVVVDSNGDADLTTKALKQKYPDCKIDKAPIYTKWRTSPNGRFHFIVGTESSFNENSELMQAVSNGIVVSKIAP